MSGAALAAAALAAVAATLLVPGRRSRRLVGRSPEGAGPRTGRPSRWAAVVSLATVLGLAPVLLDGEQLALAVIGLLATAGAVQHMVRHRAEASSRARADQMIEACAGLAADLQAGEPPQRALDRAAAEFPELAPAARAASLGADVPAALRQLATRAGAEQLSSVAAAWQVAHRTGAGLAPAVARAAASAGERRTLRRLVDGELGSVQATARLLAVLPFLVLLIGDGFGGDPIGFLTATPFGLGCLAAGLALSHAGLLWLDRIAARVLR